MQKKRGIEPLVALYHDLRKEGYQFPQPQMDEHRAPVLTPPPRETTPAAPSASVSHLPQLKGALGVLQNSNETLREILENAESKQDLNNGVVRDLLETIRGGQAKVIEEIEIVGNRGDSPEV